MRPVRNNILVKPITEDSSFVVTEKKSTQWGEVVSVGSGELVNGTSVELEVKPGDVILYRTHQHDVIEDGLVLIHILDVLAIK